MSDRAWPHTESHMWLFSSPCGVCLKKNHETSEEDVDPKSVLVWENLKSEEYRNEC